MWLFILMHNFNYKLFIECKKKHAKHIDSSKAILVSNANLAKLHDLWNCAIICICLYLFAGTAHTVVYVGLMIVAPIVLFWQCLCISLVVDWPAGNTRQTTKFLLKSQSSLAAFWLCGYPCLVHFSLPFIWHLSFDSVLARIPLSIICLLALLQIITRQLGAFQDVVIVPRSRSIFILLYFCVIVVFWFLGLYRAPFL